MSSTHRFRIVPLDADYVAHLRRTRTDAFGHHLPVYINRERGNPCRFTLRQSQPGEELLLLSHRPFVGNHPYAEVGPIFIRLHGDDAYEDVHRFPPEIDPSKRIFRAYNPAEEILDARLGTAEPESLIDELFSNPAVAFIHVRSLTYGCYTFKIERA